MTDMTACLPELPDEELVAILGRPNFMCIEIAQLLRRSGRDIPTKAEHEQAHTLLFFLRHWAADPVEWRRTATEELRAMLPSNEEGEG